MVKHYSRLSKFFLAGLFILFAFNANALIQSKAVTGNWTTPGSWVGGVAPTSTDDVEIVSGANITINGATPVCNNVTVDAGGTLTGSGTLTVSASLTNNGTLSNAAGTITFASATSNESISGSGLSFFNLTISNTGAAGSNTVSLGNNITIGGSLTISSGNLDVSATAYSVTIAKNFTNNATATSFVPETGTVIIGGAAAAVINGSAAIAFYNLTIAGTTAVTCTTNSTTISNNMVVNAGAIATINGGGKTTTVNGTLNNSGSVTVGAATLTVLGNVTNAGSGVLSFTTGNFNIGGNFSDNGIFSSSTSTTTFKGAANQAISGSTAETFCNLIIANTGAAGSNVVSPGGTLTVTNTLTFTSGVLDVTASNYALNVTKSITNNVSSAAFVPENGTVTIGGAAAGVINGSAASMTFYNLTFGGSTSTTATTYPITVTSNLVVNSGVTITITGGLTETAAILNNSGTITANASTLNVTGTATNNASGTINFTSGTLSVTGTTSNSGTIAFTTGIYTATGTLTNNGTISFTTGTLNIGSSFVNNSTFTQGTGTVDYDGTANQSISGSAGTTFYNLTINNTGASGSNIVSLGQAITVSNVLTLTAGILDASASNYSITANGIWTNNNSTAAFNAENGTVTFGAATTISGTSGTTFYNLNIAGGTTTASTTTAPVTVSGTLTIGAGNTLTVNANAVTAATVSNSGTITFTTGIFNVTNSFTNAGTINFSTGTFNMGNSLIDNGTVAFTGAGTFNITGNLTIGAAGTLTMGAAMNLYLTGNFTDNGTLTALGTFIFDGSTTQTIGGTASPIAFNKLTQDQGAQTDTVTLAQPITINSNFAITQGVFNCGANQVTGSANSMTMSTGATLLLGSTSVATAVTFPTNYTTAGIVLNSGSYVIYQANASQTISGTPTYANLTVTGGSASTTNTLAANTTVSGNILIQNGTGTVTLGLSTFTLSVAGNYTDNGALSAGTGTVNFDGTALQTLTFPSGGENFYNLTFNNTSAANPNLTVSANINVSGNNTFTKGYLDLQGHSYITTGAPTATTDTYKAGSITTSVAGANFTVTDPSSTKIFYMKGTAFGNSTNGITISVQSGQIQITNTTEYGAAKFMKSLNVDDVFGGGNYYHGPVTFRDSSTASRWRMGDNNAVADTFVNASFYANATGGSNNNFIICANSTGNAFYGTTIANSTTVGGFYIGRQNGNGNSSLTFYGPVVATVSLTGNMAFADAAAGNSSTVVFDSTISLNSTSTSTGFFYFGDSKYSTILLNSGGQFLTGSISGQTNTYLENVTQIGPKTQTINTSGSTGSLYVGGTTTAASSLPNTFNGPVNLVADTAGYIIDATFDGATTITINHANANGYLISDTCWSTLTATVGKLLFENNEFNGVTSLQHTSGNSSTVNGGNTFNAAATIINSGTASLYTGTSAGDNFNANVTFTESGTGAGNLIYVARTNTSNFTGNITVNGSNTNQVTFGSNAGNMNIDGSGTQVFATSGSAVAPLIVNMTMNQTAAGTNIFQISNFSPSVSGTLTFNTGNTGLINLNNNTLTIGTSNAATGAISYPTPTTLAGWVYGGTLARWYPSATTIPLPTAASVSTIGFYPLGSAPAQNAFEPFWIATNGAGSTKVGNTISLSQGSTAAGNTVLASHYLDASWATNVYGISVANWKVNPSTLTINAGTTMQVMFGGNGFETFLTSDINASYATTTAGTYVIPSQFYGATDFEVERTGLTIGQATGVTWYVGTSSPGASPLPIQLTSFTAQCSNYYANLQWTTASESDNDFFTIEKTQDGVNYETVSTIKGAGTSSETHNYSLVDFTPLTGTSYYRLSQTDFDGITTIVQTDVYQSCEGDQLINAFNANGIINAQIESNTSGNYTFTLINSMGQTVMQATKNVSQGLNIYKIPANYTQGVYILRITNGTVVYTNKMVL